MLEQVISNKAGWTRVALGDVVKRHQEISRDPVGDGFARFVKVEHMTRESLRLVSWGATASDEMPPTFYNVFRKGHVLFPSRNPHLRRVVQADFDGICGEKTFVVEAMPGLAEDLLPFIMQSDELIAHASRMSIGSTNLHVRWRDLTSFEFSLPPLQEQARIAEALCSHRIALESIQDSLASAKRVRLAFVEDQLVKQFSDAPLVSVADLLREPPRNGKSPRASEHATELRTVSISAIKQGVFDPENCYKNVDIAHEQAEPFLVRQGDAFAVRGNGNRSLMGKVGLCIREFSNLIYPDLLIRLRFDEATILKEFAVAQWNHPSVHASLARRAKSSNGIWKINGQDIRAHSLRVPSIARQGEVVCALNGFDAQLEAIRTREESLRNLQERIIDEAFNEGKT